MPEWTQAAKAIFKGYLENLRKSLDGSGADVDEVTEDIERHVEEEVRSRGLSIVSEEDIKRILSELGHPVETPNTIKDRISLKSAGKTLSGFFFCVFGIVLPCVTIMVELLSDMCSSALFDPIPTPGHVFLLFTVPISNLLIFIHLKTTKQFPLKRLGLLNGIAMGTAGFYSLLFLPILPIACIAVMFMGLGFLPLTPLLSFICTLTGRRSLKKHQEGKTSSVPGLWIGLLISFLLLIAFEIPSTLTRAAMKMAVSETESTRLHGLNLLRTFGDDDLMLRMCYVRTGRATDMISFLFSLGDVVQPDEARTIYYQATGTPFTARPRPELSGFGRGFDEGLGGKTIGGIMEGLSLSGSSMDASIDPDAALSYLEWTLEFKNTCYRQREARAVVVLPPGGVVTRLTLWVNGEEREAAFAARGKVTEAYQNIVRQRRDPVLITTRGDDRILVQCFPVPSNGTMKIRFGITAPLVLETLAEGIMPLPLFADRNFKINKSFRHTIWVESEHPVTGQASSMKTENPKKGLYACRGQLTTKELSESRALIKAERVSDVIDSWTFDPHAPEKNLILQTLKKTAPSVPSTVVVVIDGSETMIESKDSIAEMLQNLPDTIQYKILVASDTVIPLSPELVKATQANLAESAKKVRDMTFRGGCDNVPALIQAWEICSDVPDSAVLWIHGSIYEIISTPDGLLQRFKRRPGTPVFYDLQVENGPNRIVETTENTGLFKNMAITYRVDLDMKRLLDTWAGTGVDYTFQRQHLRINDAGDTTKMDKTSSHLARLWALETINELLKNNTETNREKAITLAAGYQLVTQVSGAVVLETREQFDAAGLTPAEPGSVPTIPEPEFWILVAMVVVMLMVVLGSRNRIYGS